MAWRVTLATSADETRTIGRVVDRVSDALERPVDVVTVETERTSDTPVTCVVCDLRSERRPLARLADVHGRLGDSAADATTVVLTEAEDHGDGDARTAFDDVVVVPERDTDRATVEALADVVVAEVERAVETPPISDGRFLDRVPIPLFAIDADHEVTHWNAAIETLTGQSAADVEGAGVPHDPFYDGSRPVLADLIVDGADDAAIGEWYDDWTASPYDEDGYVGEGHFPGVDAWLQFAVNPIETADGEVVGAIETLHDITPRKERERALERYATVVEASGDPVYTLDADGYVTFANDALTQMIGYDTGDIVGSHVSMVMSDEDVAVGEELIREVLRSPDRTRGTFEMDVTTADGETIACENHVAILPHDETFRGTVGILRDITERKRRERKLQEERDRFTALFETIPEPIAHVRFVDGEPIVQTVNSTFSEKFGVDEERLMGTSINDAIVPEHLVESAQTIDATAATSSFVEREVQRQTPEGLIDVLLRATRFQSVGGHRESIVAYLDISDQKARHRELERQNERLDEFASVVSHDLRNPLTVAKGRLEMALEDGDQSHLPYVVSSLDRMEDLIEDVLALAVQGEPVTDLEAVSLATVANRSWAVVETGPDASLAVEGDCTFLASRSRVRSLFENLFRNAVEHVGPDVTVTVRPTDTGFTVEDDGPGLPTDGTDVFESGYSTNPGGTGFGLNIVREIADAHGWSIAASNGLDGGARFDVDGVETAS